MAQTAPTATKRPVTTRASWDQATVMVVICVAAFALCALTVDGFRDLSNLRTALVSGVPLAILGLAMAITIIGGTIDFSLLVTAVCSAEVFIVATGDGHTIVTSLLLGAGFALAVGVLNGVLVAYVELPPLVVTIATALLVFGLSRITFFEQTSNVVPGEARDLRKFLTSSPGGVPTPLIALAVIGLLLHLALRRTVPGRFLFAKGDNPAAARLTGLPVRPVTMAAFAGAALLAFLAGMVMISLGGALSAPQATSSMLYDIITIAVIGGVSLAGGRGRVVGVLAGALLISILLNALTLLDFDSNEKALVQGAVLLVALGIDAVLHPRSLEDFRSGDL
jgi:ribose transport system permease protein